MNRRQATVRAIEVILVGLGRSATLMVQSLVALPMHTMHWRALLTQHYFVGFLSLSIMVVSGAFIGMVVTVQGYDILSRFGADAVLSQLVALSVYRELGPVLGGLLFAGRAGTAMAAEIGLMQVTEQIPSLEVMAVDTHRLVYFPRVWASLITVPLLVILFDFMAIMGSALIAIGWLGLDGATFWSTLQSSVDFYRDILMSLLKSVLFGWLVAWAALYQGTYCEKTAAGVAYAATKTVVFGSLAILGGDLLFSVVSMGGA